MLLLTRRPQETIIVTTPDGTEIRFTIMGLKGNQVRLGIDAPKDVDIVREEIADRPPPTDVPAA